MSAVKPKDFILFLIVLACAGHSALASGFGQNGIATIDFPVTGVRLGDGVDLVTGLSTGGSCVEGATQGVGNAKTPQVVIVSLRNNKDASTYFQELNVSASAQVSFLGVGSASAKVKYVTKHQFEQTTDTISVYETVEQHEYLMPAEGANPPAEAPGQRINLSALNGIRLNRRAATLLSRGKFAQFQSECGSGFAAVLIEGGELIATLTVHDHKATDSNTLDSSGSISAFGDSVNTTVQSVVNESSNGHAVTFDLFTSGGSGDPVPTNKDELLAKVKSLAQNVVSAPIPFQIVVRSYQSLPDFPNIPPFAEPTPLDDIMALFWRTDAILTQAIDSSRPIPPSQFGNPFVAGNRYLLGFNAATPDQINNVVDQLIAKRTQLAEQAKACAQSHTCGPPTVSQVDIYSLAARLPLPIFAATPNLGVYEEVLNNVIAAANNFNVAKSRAIADALGEFGKGPGPDPNCSAQNRVVASELGSQAAQFFSALNTAEDRIENVVPSLLRNDAVDFYVRRPLRARCAPSPFDLACKLTEADIAQITQSVPAKAGIQIKPESGPDRINQFGPCPFMSPTGTIPLAGFVFSPKS